MAGHYLAGEYHGGGHAMISTEAADMDQRGSDRIVKEHGNDSNVGY